MIKNKHVLCYLNILWYTCVCALMKQTCSELVSPAGWYSDHNKVSVCDPSQLSTRWLQLVGNQLHFKHKRCHHTVMTFIGTCTSNWTLVLLNWSVATSQKVQILQIFNTFLTCVRATTKKPHLESSALQNMRVNRR